MNKGLIISIFAAIVIIGGAIFFTQNKDEGNEATTSETTLTKISSSDLTAADGKNGAKCWVAIDGTVYEIEQGFKWTDGEHTESAEAYCGADLSNVIDRAPHGRSKLSQLEKVGTL